MVAAYNNQAGWLLTKAESGLAQAINICRAEARHARRETMQQQRVAAGQNKQAVRDAQLSSKRAKKEAWAKEERRLDALPLATKYSQLISMGNAELSDQLKAHKLRRKRAKQEVVFTVTQKNRLAYVLTLQALLREADPDANDLAGNDPGTDAVGVTRKKRAPGEASKKAKKPKQLSDAHGNIWEEDEEFEGAVILRTRVSEGAKAGDIGRKGQLLYFIAWEGYSADASTWEPASNVGKELIEEYQASLREEAEADGAADAELESDEEGEADEEPESADTAEDMQI